MSDLGMMPEISQTAEQRRNRIAELLMAQELAQQQPQPQPHSPASTPGWDASMANFTDMLTPDNNAVAQSLADMNAADKAAAQAAAQNSMTDFATAGARSSGNLFEGGFTMPTASDPFDPGAPAPGSTPSIADMSVTPAPGFGPNAPTPSTNPTDFNPGSSFDLGALGNPGAMAAAMAADTAAAQGGDFGGPGEGSGQGDTSGSEGASGGVG